MTVRWRPEYALRKTVCWPAMGLQKPSTFWSLGSAWYFPRMRNYLRLSSIVFLASLAACGSGGGGSAHHTNDGNDSGTPTQPGDGDEGGDGDEPSADAGPGDDGDAGQKDPHDAYPNVPTSCSDYTKAHSAVVQADDIVNLYDFYDYDGDVPAKTGVNPRDSLVEGPDGNLYGVTNTGGQKSPESSANGVLFRLTPGGEVHDVFTFDYETYGYSPNGGLVVGPDCALYGTTSDGGKDRDGTIFRITVAGQIHFLADFTVDTGTEPHGPLLFASDGNIYGTATRNGAYRDAANNAGTIFKLTPDGALSALVSLNEKTTGAFPLMGLVESDGYLYGMTGTGGAHGKGTIFRVSLAGNLEVLWSFPELTEADDKVHGSGPNGGLTKGADGNFYGITTYGGANSAGTIFKITPTGEYTTVHSFYVVDEALGCNCGISAPTGRMILASDGNFYGSASSGASMAGTGEAGGIFRMTPAGEVTPWAWYLGFGGSQGALAESSDHFLYGVSETHGAHELGAVYRARLSQ
jgi:uncharacterized repeat protein (TIGR03803 family)